MYDTKYADVVLGINEKQEGGKPEDLRFTVTKQKALSLLAGFIFPLT